MSGEDSLWETHSDSVPCLALDVGERRTGVAAGEIIARPITTLQSRSRQRDFAAIVELVRAHRAQEVIVGLPLNMDGSVGPQAVRVQGYAEQLQEALTAQLPGVVVVLWDERLSTQDAAQILIASGRKRRDRRERLDAVAAATILQSYLDRPRPHASPGHAGERRSDALPPQDVESSEIE